MLVTGVPLLSASDRINAHSRLLLSRFLQVTGKKLLLSGGSKQAAFPQNAQQTLDCASNPTPPPRARARQLPPFYGLCFRNICSES
jgi:hypothetical protein